MHATIRRIRTKPGKAADVAGAIESEYLPLVKGVDGFVSYTLVDLGDDEVTSMGVFTSPAAAASANELAKDWAAETLGPFIASPLEARAGSVLVDFKG